MLWSFSGLCLRRNCHRRCRQCALLLLLMMMLLLLLLNCCCCCCCSIAAAAAAAAAAVVRLFCPFDGFRKITVIEFYSLIINYYQFKLHFRHKKETYVIRHGCNFSSTILIVRGVPNCLSFGDCQ
jgi:hypothetical protein